MLPQPPDVNAGEVITADLINEIKRAAFREVMGVNVRAGVDGWTIIPDSSEYTLERWQVLLMSEAVLHPDDTGMSGSWYVDLLADLALLAQYPLPISDTLEPLPDALVSFYNGDSVFKVLKPGTYTITAFASIAVWNIPGGFVFPHDIARIRLELDAVQGSTGLIEFEDSGTGTDGGGPTQSHIHLPTAQPTVRLAIPPLPPIDYPLTVYPPNYVLWAIPSQLGWVGSFHTKAATRDDPVKVSARLWLDDRDLSIPSGTSTPPVFIVSFKLVLVRIRPTSDFGIPVI